MTPTQYDIEKWAAATTRGRHVFNHNYRMLGNELRGWELVNAVTMEPEPGVQEQVYLWQKQGGSGEELLRISLVERSSWRNAQQQLRGQLYHSMRADIPRAAGKLAKLGDVSFVGQDPETKGIALVAFTRGNMYVSVSSVGDILVDVSNVARKLDRTFNEPPKDAEIKKGQAEDTSPESLKVKARESTTVLEQLPVRAARGRWLKIIAPDGELRREDDNLIYVSSKAGKKKIAAYAVYH